VQGSEEASFQVLQERRHYKVSYMSGRLSGCGRASIREAKAFFQSRMSPDISFEKIKLDDF
jgi:hypothetical protein